jgi:hypothetical protein
MPRTISGALRDARVLMRTIKKYLDWRMKAEVMPHETGYAESVQAVAGGRASGDTTREHRLWDLLFASYEARQLQDRLYTAYLKARIETIGGSMLAKKTGS